MRRTATLTGAAQGPGEAIARRLAADDDRVVVDLNAAGVAAGFVTGATLDVNGGMLMR